MSASSSLTLCQSAFPSTRQLSPSVEYSSLLPQHFHTLKPWKRALVRKTKVPAIIRQEKRIARVRVSASYTKRPMETKGAYELIDEETGERVIVWGGVDDDDSSIPSKDVLFWNPKSQEQTTAKTKESSPVSIQEMPSSSSCRGAYEMYPQYNMEVICRSCGRVADIKISRSRDNPGRLFFRCTECDKFLKWAKPISGGATVDEADQGRVEIMMHQVEDIRKLLTIMNTRVGFGIMLMVVIAIVVAVK